MPTLLIWCTSSCLFYFNRQAELYTENDFLLSTLLNLLFQFALYRFTNTLSLTNYLRGKNLQQNQTE